MTKLSASDLAHALQKHGEHASLMHILEEVQSQYRYLPQDAMILVSDRLGLPLSQVYSVATFYHAFSLLPRGLHTLQVCTGTACHVRMAARLIDTIHGELGIAPGETTEDGSFTLERVNCLGCCALGPVVVLDGVYNDHMNSGKLRRLIAAVQDEDKKGKSSDAKG